MTNRLCRWCGKQRTKFSGMEKRSLLSERWSEMCNYCYRRHRNVTCNNPWAGLFGDWTRQVRSADQTTGEPEAGRGEP